jgi:hypothetical protein
MAISVRHGVNELKLDTLAGKTITEVRDQLADILNIPENAQARLNGSPISNDSTLSDGASVEFVKTAGEKGA